MASKKRKKNWIDDTWWGPWVILGGMFGGLLIITWLSTSKNPLSPIISIISIVGIIVCGYLLYKLIKEKSTDHAQNKNKIKYISIAISVCTIMAILGLCTVQVEIPLFSETASDVDSEKETVITKKLSGLDKNTVPLGISDLKLLKKGKYYTVICTLNKNSSDPDEGFFKFDVALIDKNGKYVDTANINTLDFNLSLFTYNSTYHLEKTFIVNDNKNKPVKVEFSNVKEYGEAEYIQFILIKAREYVNNKFYTSAREYINKVLEYDPNNEEAKSLLEQATNPTNNTATPAPSSPSDKDVLIGTSKANVRRLLNKYKETKSIMSSNALDFEDNDLLITVYFNSNDIADGVLFMQNDLDNVDTLTGVGSYVSKHYDELVRLATDDPNIKIETDLTLYNSHGVKKQPMDLYIGNIPNNKSSNSSSSSGEGTKSSNSSKAETPSNNTETKSKSEFSQCLTSGIAMGVKLYATPNNDSYVGTITNVSNDILDERGKKTKAVYISGGKADGWYKRSDVGTLYVRNDDPHLPAGRYAAEAMGAN